ncbi:pimeloyl-ACP methyl ester carboxylesterase [Diaminobutyricimonas aerilata]|uniref:Pimeloyl-ACP methyl ester carboxylesterase n=1 Tax=Diaminobutyricimonas aerilata TaxID=1162967 RepID=A0A2M9CFG1_9MICO|nr:alpha/beta fold hydrolase [Diaminobutyricimonas aerilata]PJJ70585.1 pimeloyl-ACP methyl ester carboxylesterase [Diaminobutyricimonas aerilata]
MQYSMPGLWVTEHTIPVPLDWSRPDRGDISVFVREFVDPDRRDDDLPLLTYLQGGPGGANPRPLSPGGWLEEALRHYRVVLVDQRGTGLSTPLDAEIVARQGDGTAGADHLALFRADSIVRDLERVRAELYGGRRWATLAQSYGGWLTMTYLSTAPEALTACYICGGVPGIPASAAEVYRRTFTRVEQKTAEFYRRYPQDVERVAAIADVLAAGDVLLPDGDVLTVRRFQSLGIDFGMKPGFERIHWLLEKSFAEPGRLSPAFLGEVLTLTSSAGNPLFWTLQESIYGDADNGPTGWAAQAERDRRPQFDESRRPLLFTGEMAFPWMFDEVRLLRGFAPAVHELARRTEWSPLYDRERLAANDVPVAAAVYFDDMYVDAHLQLDTLTRVGNAQYWVTNEFEHDGIGSGRTFTRLRELVRDRGGELTAEGNRR